MSGITDFRSIPAWKRDCILFWSFLRIAALVIGGGYAIIAAAQQEFVHRRRWLTEDDVLEMITITQTVPGIIACNAAAYIGWRISGYFGALAAMTGAVLPSLAVIMLIAAGMREISGVLEAPPVQGAFKGLISCIVGMVIVTALKMRKKAVKELFGWSVAAVCFAGMMIFKLNPVCLILAAVAAGIIKIAADRKRGAGK